MFKRIIWISVFLGWFASPFSAVDLPSSILFPSVSTAIADDDANKDKHADDQRHADEGDDEKADKNSHSNSSGNNNADEGTAGGVTPTPAPPVPVVDITPPVIVPPLNITQEATGSLTNVILGVASVTDNVNVGLIATPSVTGAFALGVNTVTWRASDAAGNIGIATQTVTITDTTPPVISIGQPAITVEATVSPTPVNLGLVTASDLVSGAIVPVNNAPATFPLGVTQVVWTATDAAGNTASATQNVVVQDTTPPIITVPAAVTVDSTTGQPIAVVIGTATAIDAFAPVTIINNAPATFPLGATTVIWTATDANGNAVTATQLVTVNDTSVLAGLPPDPGAAGKLTLAGIDSDNDGVRDDVQRWIAITFPHSQKTRAALRQMAGDFQNMLLWANDKQRVYDAFIRMGMSTECIEYIDPINSYDTGSLLESMVMNTALRSRAYMQASRNLSGRGIASLGIGNEKQGCKFNPDAMPN